MSIEKYLAPLDRMIDAFLGNRAGGASQEQSASIASPEPEPEYGSRRRHSAIDTYHSFNERRKKKGRMASRRERRAHGPRKSYAERHFGEMK